MIREQFIFLKIKGWTVVTTGIYNIYLKIYKYITLLFLSSYFYLRQHLLFIQVFFDTQKTYLLLKICIATKTLCGDKWFKKQYPSKTNYLIQHIYF